MGPSGMGPSTLLCRALMITNGNCGRSVQRGSTTTMTDCLIFLSQIIWIGLLGLQKSVGMTEKGSLALLRYTRVCQTCSTAIMVTAHSLKYRGKLASPSTLGRA